jgi:predicted RNA-binding protein with PIN domain
MMNPHYLIDGYNLIHHIPRFRNSLGSGLEHARNILISFARTYLAVRKVKITIVFDGDEVGYIDNSTLSAQRLKIIYSKPPEKADPIIKRLIQKSKNNKSLFLVSADNDLIQFGKQNRIQVLSPEEFYHRASKHPNEEQMDQKFNSHVSEDEVNEWLKLFMENNE